MCGPFNWPGAIFLLHCRQRDIMNLECCLGDRHADKLHMGIKWNRGIKAIT